MSELEQEIKQTEKKNKMGVGSKILLTGGTLTGIAYLSGKKVKSWFFPPSKKKYLALGAMLLFFYGISNRGCISREVTGAYQGVKTSAVRKIDGSAERESLKKRLEEQGIYIQQLEASENLKEQALADSRKYILSLEGECFNAVTTLNTQKIKINAPPKEAFLNYLLHDKQYNAILYKIDSALGKPKGGE